jgi:predicted ribosome quality control (RQC) complex YloA/Tae2 family protein
MNQSPIITALIAHIAAECKPVDLEQRYRNTLDEVCGEISVGNLTFSASRIVEELDPTAFRCGVADSSDGFTEIDGSYYDTDELDRAKQAFIEERETELAALDKQENVEAEIHRLENELAELEAHSF